jgi:hypothetical protein
MIKKGNTDIEMFDMDQDPYFEITSSAHIHGGRHDGFEYGTDDIATISISSHFHDKTKIILHGGISNGDVRGIYYYNVLSAASSEWKGSCGYWCQYCRL